MDYLYQDISSLIFEAADTVYGYLGNGYLEKVYENALVIELQKRKLKVETQVKIHVYYYDGQKIGSYVADMMVEDKIIIELKVSNYIAAENYAQLLNYLKTTNKRLGIMINFGGKTMFFKRLIN